MHSFHYSASPVSSREGVITHISWRPTCQPILLLHVNQVAGPLADLGYTITLAALGTVVLLTHMRMPAHAHASVAHLRCPGSANSGYAWDRKFLPNPTVNF